MNWYVGKSFGVRQRFKETKETKESKKIEKPEPKPTEKTFEEAYLAFIEELKKQEKKA